MSTIVQWKDPLPCSLAPTIETIVASLENLHRLCSSESDTNAALMRWLSHYCFNIGKGAFTSVYACSLQPAYIIRLSKKKYIPDYIRERGYSSIFCPVLSPQHLRGFDRTIGSYILYFERYATPNPFCRDRFFHERDNHMFFPYFIRSLVLQLKAIHDQKIIHSDIKTGNILFCYEHILSHSYGYPLPLIIDYGSCEHEGEINCVVTRQTEYVRAPEQTLHACGLWEKPVTTAIDMWSLGIVMLELLGAIIWTDVQLNDVGIGGDGASEQMQHILNKQPHIKATPYIPWTNKITDTVLVDFIRRLLKIDPDERLTATQALEHPYLTSIDAAYFLTIEPSIPTVPRHSLLQSTLWQSTPAHLIKVYGQTAAMSKFCGSPSWNLVFFMGLLAYSQVRSCSDMYWLSSIMHCYLGNNINGLILNMDLTQIFFRFLDLYDFPKQEGAAYEALHPDNHKLKYLGDFFNHKENGPWKSQSIMEWLNG